MKHFAAALAAVFLFGTAAAEPAAERYVILVTLDGVRTQDLFGGMDPVIANAPEAQSGAVFVGEFGEETHDAVTFGLRALLCATFVFNPAKLWRTPRGRPSREP